MNVKTKKKRRAKTSLVLFLVSLMMLVSIVPAFAAPVKGTPEITINKIPPDTILTYTTDGVSNIAGGKGILKLRLIKNQSLSVGKYLTTTISDTNGRTISQAFVRYSDSLNNPKITLQDAVTRGLAKLKREDGTEIAISDISGPDGTYNFTISNVNSKSLTLELYATETITYSGDGSNPQQILHVGMHGGGNLDNFLVVEAPLFNLNETSVSVTQSSETVKITGNITSGYSGAIIQYRVNNGSWISGGSAVNHDGYGTFDITLNKSLFTSVNNLVDVRIQSDDGIYSQIKTCTVVNNFLENPDPDPDPQDPQDPGDPGNPGNPGGNNGGTGSFKINFNVGDMFKHSNSVISGFMVLLTVIVGISVGFRVVRFIKDLF